MNANVIAVVLQRLAVIYIWVVMALVFVGVPLLIIIYQLGLNKRLKNMSRNWKLSRMELGKLADELQQVRKQNEGDSKST